MGEALTQKIAIIGADPASFTCGMLLLHSGFQVEILESREQLISCDLGLNLVFLPQILEEIFKTCGRSLEDYLHLKRIDPICSISFDSKSKLNIFQDFERNLGEMQKIFPNDLENFQKYFKDSDCMSRNFLKVWNKSLSKVGDLLDLDFLKVYSYLSPKSVEEVFSKQFRDLRLQQLLAFFSHSQGLAPVDCPAHLAFMPLVLQRFGVRYLMGGTNGLLKILAKVFEELGGKIIFNAAVSKVEVQSKTVRALRFENGWERKYSAVIFNGESFSKVSQIIEASDRPSWSNARLDKLAYSASAFVIQLRLNTILPLELQTLLFSKNTQKNDEEIYKEFVIPRDPSIVISNPSRMDPGLAPKGKSLLTIMVLVPNLHSAIKWETEKAHFKNKIYSQILDHTAIDLRALTEEEVILTPHDLEEKFGFKYGGIFGLAQNLDQTLQMRPPNKIGDLSNLFVIGSGTHPGAGLAFELISAQIGARLCKEELLKSRSHFEVPSFFRSMFKFSKPRKNVFEITSQNIKK